MALETQAPEELELTPEQQEKQRKAKREDYRRYRNAIIESGMQARLGFTDKVFEAKIKKLVKVPEVVRACDEIRSLRLRIEQYKDALVSADMRRRLKHWVGAIKTREEALIELAGAVAEPVPA